MIIQLNLKIFRYISCLGRVIYFTKGNKRNHNKWITIIESVYFLYCLSYRIKYVRPKYRFE